MSKKMAAILYIIGWGISISFLVLSLMKILPAQGMVLLPGGLILGFVSIWQGVLAIKQHRVGLGIALILVGPFFGWAHLSVFEKNKTNMNVSNENK